MEIKTGILGNDGIEKDILSELLSQHGILFENIKQDLNNKYPCVIIYNVSKNIEDNAINRCLNIRNIINT